MELPFFLQMITLRGHSFMPAPLDRSSTVIDLGAHRGEFSRQIIDRFGCRCVAVEANPSLLDKVRAANGVEPLWGAITDRDGSSIFYLSDNPEASTLSNESTELNGRRINVPTFTLESILRNLGISHVQLLKVDIEGAEIPFLLSVPEQITRLIDQITVEFHDFCGLVSADQIQNVRARLASLNFEEINFGTGDRAWINTNCLFVRRDAPRIGRLRRWYLKFVVLNVRRVVHLCRALFPSLGADALHLS